MMKIGEIRLCAGEHARRTRFAKTDRVSSKFQRRFTNKIGRFGNDGREFRNPRGSFRPNRCRREPSATSFALLKPPPSPIRQTQISRFAQYLKNTSSRLWILWLLSREKEGDSTRLDSTRRGARLRYSRSICTPDHFQVIACYTLPAPLYLSKGSFITPSETRGGKEIGCFINRAFPLLFPRRSIFHAIHGATQRRTESPNFFERAIRQKSGRCPSEYLKGGRARKGERKSENYGGPARRAVHAITNLRREGNV